MEFGLCLLTQAILVKYDFPLMYQSCTTQTTVAAPFQLLSLPSRLCFMVALVCLSVSNITQKVMNRLR